MFRFNVKVNNEHKLKTKSNNEHRFNSKIRNEYFFSMIAWGATIFRSIGGHVTYVFDTKIEKALIKAKSIPKTTTYHMRQAISEHLQVKGLLNGVLYKSKNTLLAKSWLRGILTSINQRFSTSARERFIVKMKHNAIVYKSNTRVVKEGFQVKTLPALTLYASKTTTSIKAWIRTSSNLLFSSRTNLLSKAWVRSRPGGIIQRYVATIGDKYQLRSSTSATYHSRTSIKSLLIQRTHTASNLYRSTVSEVEKILVRLRSILTFRSRTVMSAIAHMRNYGSNLVRSTSTLKPILGIKGVGSDRYTSKTACLSKSLARATGSVRNSLTSQMARINSVMAKITVLNSFRSSTSIEGQKTYQYYAIKLNEYDRPMADLPEDLLTLCYVHQRDWKFVSKAYRTWNDIKDRITSWNEVKE